MCVSVCVRASVCMSVRACVYVCVCVCVSLASDPSETIKVIIIKFGTVTASDMIMHHVCNAHHVYCEDSPTKGLYNLFFVR